jgi:hypothetical protein
MIGISPGDVRCLTVSVVQPVVNVDRNVDGSSEQPVASGFVQHRIADAVELTADCVRVKSTEMVEQCSCYRIP